MAYIAPDTDLRILYDVPLDTSYEHSIYFGSPSAQFNYFSGKTKYTLSNLTYQRVQRGYIRVEKNAEDLYDCNYIMFRNHAFGTKWFYAFITGVEYISNTVSQINFQLDVLQTWLFNFEFRYAFIERQHTESDDLFEHYEPEPVPVGEYVLNNYDMIDKNELPEVDRLFDLGVMIAVIELDNGKPKGGFYNGVYHGTKLYFFKWSGTITADIADFLANYIATPGNVVDMYMCPSLFVPYVEPDHSVQTSTKGYSTAIELPPVEYNDTLDGYTPRNRKLYTYPYNFLHIDNGSNGELSLRYEFFNGAPEVELYGTIVAPVSALIIPRNYKGVSGTHSTYNPKTYNPESLPLTDYPTCSWSFDSYQQWLNTQAISKSIRLIGKVGRAVASAGSKEEVIARGAGELVDYATDMIASGYMASIEADICKGSSSNGQMNCTRDQQTYFYGRCSVNKQSAEMIDTFFDKYGYAINKVGAPNLHARPLWTYIKTRDCTIEGNVPAPDMKLICNIFNKGVTFWTNGDQIGRYDLASQNVAPVG